MPNRDVQSREKMIVAHVARRLREARAGLALDQQALARRAGRTQAAVSLWESGRRRVSIAELDELASHLGKPLAYFLDWDSADV